MARIAKGASYLHRVRQGVYVARSLEIARLTEMSQAVLTLALALLATGRAWEDADIAAFGASAARNTARQDLRATVGDARATLAGRGRGAVRKQPYTLIVPDGVAWYIAAPLAELIERHKVLISRLRAHLTAGDPVLATIPLIEAGLAAFRAGEDILSGAELTLDEKRQALRKQEAEFDTAMISLQGALQQHYGSEDRAKAHFPPRG